MFLQLTRRCEPSCPECAAAGSAQELAPQWLEQAVAAARALGHPRLDVLGGEPICSPLFEAALARCAEHGLALGITSHGWQVEAYCQRLRAAAPAYLRLALRSPHAERHDRLTGAPGSFARVLAAIDRYCAAGWPVIVRHGLRRDGLGELGALGALLGPRRVTLELSAAPELAGTQAAWDAEPQVGERLLPELAALKQRLEERLVLEPSIGNGVLYSYCSNFSALDKVLVHTDGAVAFCHVDAATAPGAALGALTDEPLGAALLRHPPLLASVWQARLRAQASGRAGVGDNCLACQRARGR